MQVKKLQDRVQRCKEEVQRTRERYEASLQEINEYNAKYMEDMTVVFDKCQEFEQRRLHFFKEMLFGIHACLNISTDPEYVWFPLSLAASVGATRSEGDAPYLCPVYFHHKDRVRPRAATLAVCYRKT